MIEIFPMMKITYLKMILVLVLLVSGLDADFAQSGLSAGTRVNCAAGFAGCNATEQMKPQSGGIERNAADGAGISGPRFDVSQFGAVGNGLTDDTAAVQAAFDACWNNGTGIQPYGGTVEFPGNHTYILRSTINAYDTCRIEGAGSGAGESGGAQAPVRIDFTLPNKGKVYELRSFTISDNVSSMILKHNPADGDRVTVNGTTITFVSSRVAEDEVLIGADAAVTAKSLVAMLNASNDRNLKASQPYTNPSSGVVACRYQGAGYWETFLATNPAAISAQTALTPPSSPRGGRAVAYHYLAIFSVENSLAPGDWVLLKGFTANGVVLNRVVAQVARASAASFAVTLPFTPFIPLAGSKVMLGTFSDSGMATTTTVGFAFDSYARNQQEISNVDISGGSTMGVGIYFGSRLDAGSRVMNTWVEQPTYFGYYLSDGGINVEFDKGWRSDGAGLAGIYWRVVAGDNFRIANGTDNVSINGGGAALMLDASSCDLSNIEGTLSHVDMESDAFNIAPGLGVITLYDCGGSNFAQQFYLNLDGVTESETAAVQNPGILMSPPNDEALQLTITNSSINGQSAAKRWVGVPALIRADMNGSAGWISFLNYSPPLNSLNTISAGWRSPAQLVGDVNIGQLWEDGVRASALLYSEPDFASLPNGTTLFAGQIVAPPAYWGGTNGKRYALSVVDKTGTAGQPNGGETRCERTATAWQLKCTSAADLSIGQAITIGPINTHIQRINATDPGAVLLNTDASVSAITTPATLSFTAPVLGPEIQLPSKSDRAPSSLDWVRGDFEQNSEAGSNGIAAWVNVGSGKPGMWAGIPLGDSKGQISPSQLSGTSGSGSVLLSKAPTVNGLTDVGTTNLNNVSISGTCSGCSGPSVRTAQAFCVGTATSSATLGLFGAGGSTTTCTSIVGKENAGQLLMTTAGTLSNLAVRCAHGGKWLASGLFSVWDLPSGVVQTGAASGVNTGLFVTYGLARANTTLYDTSHTFNYAKGDLLRIQFTTQADETLGSCEAGFNY